MNFAFITLWFGIWRDHIRSAEKNPRQADGYCRAAMIAQMEMVCYQAFYHAEIK